MRDSLVICCSNSLRGPVWAVLCQQLALCQPALLIVRHHLLLRPQWDQKWLISSLSAQPECGNFLTIQYFHSFHWIPPPPPVCVIVQFSWLYLWQNLRNNYGNVLDNESWSVTFQVSSGINREMSLESCLSILVLPFCLNTFPIYAFFFQRCVCASADAHLNTPCLLITCGGQRKCWSLGARINGSCEPWAVGDGTEPASSEE